MRPCVLHRSKGVSCLLAAALLAAAMATATSAEAQVVASADATAPRFLVASGSAGQRVEVDAGTVRPLQRTVALALDGATVAEALDAIGRRAELMLTYDPAIMRAGRRVTIRSAGLPVATALAEVLAGSGLDVLVSGGGHLAIVPRRELAVRDTGSITGRVTDAKTREELVGAIVTVDGTELRGTTGSSGSFRLDGVPAGSRTLRVRYIGYVPATLGVVVPSGREAIADVLLARSVQPLEQVVVTGTVVETEVKALPSPITVVTAEDIQRGNVQRIDQLFRGMVPGTTSWDNGTNDWFTTIRIRGSTDLSGFPSIKTYVDGVAVADPASISNIDPEIVERIEVIRGPQASTIYGSGAIDGVIQIFTKKGRAGLDRPEVRGKVSVGSVDRAYEAGQSLRQDHSLQIEGGGSGFTYFAGGSYQSVGEWMPEYYSRMPSLSAGARVTHGSLTTDISARFGSRKFSRAWNTQLRDAGYPPFAKPPNQDYEIGQGAYSVSLSFRATPRWEHNLTGGFDGQTLEYYTTEPRYVTPADSLLNVFSSRWGQLSARYTTTYRLSPGEGGGSSVTAGIDYSSLHHSQLYAANASRREGDIDGQRYIFSRLPSDNFAAFVQAQVGVADALFITGGVRADRGSTFGSDVGTKIAPRIGATLVREVGALTVKSRASYGESIRPPQVQHQQALMTPTVQQLSNPDLAPERQHGWDAGVDLYAGYRASLSVTYYDQTATDLIDLVILDAGAQPRTQQYQNVGIVRNTGWELEAELRPTPSLALSGSLTRMNSVVRRLSPTYTGELRTGDDLLGIPRYTAGAMIAYSPGPLRLSVEATLLGRWVERDWLAYYGVLYAHEPSRGTLREYWMDYPAVRKFNVAASRDVTDHAEAFLRIDNLTGNRAYERVNVETAMGRAVTAGLRLRY